MRKQIYDFLSKELIGPDPIPPFIQENGQEIVLEPPRMRYSAGILFPQGVSFDQTEQTNDGEQSQIDETFIEGEDNNIEHENKISGANPDDGNDSTEEIINLSNNYLPSAMGFSCILRRPINEMIININTGVYKQGDYNYESETGKTVSTRGYFRKQIEFTTSLNDDELPKDDDPVLVINIMDDRVDSGLHFLIRNRTSRTKQKISGDLFTFTLINNKNSTSSTIKNRDCFFQVSFSLDVDKSSFGFMAIPDRSIYSNDHDILSNSLLYRNKKTYSIGHGCAPKWEEIRNGVYRIETSSLPVNENNPIIPCIFDGIDFSMKNYSNPEDKENTIGSLQHLCDDYSKWIKENNSKIDSLIDEHKSVAQRHLKECNQIHKRMIEGLRILETDEVAFDTFVLMNKGMLMQQLHFNQKLRKWKQKDKTIVIDPFIQPDIVDKKTWPDWDEEKRMNTKLGNWRPFQIAFILLNISGLINPAHDDRKIVDLIWFPTGGGKTEAYLGLTAFVIFLRKLINSEDEGTAVLMRYTLRLLTSQQFQRAASLICSCEKIRSENEEKLGVNKISIGLWVGQGLTPNKRQTAVQSLRQLEQHRTNENPFILLKCPWCGAQMGPETFGNRRRIFGYKHLTNPSTVGFCCKDRDCEFSTRDRKLPLIIIDEEIYETPPTLLIGTVDKFALLPWKIESSSIFGRNSQHSTPPELIIQDELHLISGPLGSMVGHFETVISELCRNHNNGTGPKIIGSTATISRARSQCHALYNCGQENVAQFPPQLLNAGDSFFAKEDDNGKGRQYVGIYTSSGISHASTQVRVIASLLQAVKSAEVEEEVERDPYWTILNYFNSLRELGHAATLISADIREYLNAMWSRKRIKKTENGDPRRFVNKYIELTSRVPGSDIPNALQSLESKYPVEDNEYPVDICLATNMISVGVDISRLGLMAVTGQPKTTSEYIQATSRVGRSKKGPGLVVIIYNPSKPRDRSHFEQFHSYHENIYSRVEPTSITPFSSPIRDRALHAIIISLVRHLFESNRERPQPMPTNEIIENVVKIVSERVSGVDPEELEGTINLVKERFEEWKNHYPPMYGSFSPPTEELQLMYQAGTTPRAEWGEKAWPTQTSMRNVDATCEAQVIGSYIPIDAEDGT